ncbi:MAG: hypothetical protein EA377_00630 [Phycisphaerales bacterium]|nr:MAG: hypothetical protein EA377_00630 [Phycisphaerales bacterium]
MMFPLLLGYLPFVVPLHFFNTWWYVLLVPLAFGIAVIYKATRLARLEDFWRQVIIMTTQIILAMIGLAIALTVLVQLVIPRLPVG